jgi:hypothetical protein
MSARRDPALKQLAEDGQAELKIAACFPRAVKWLFSAADATLPEQGVEILNMRVETAEKVAFAILGEGFGAAPPAVSLPAVSLSNPPTLSNGAAAPQAKELT